MKFPSEKQIKRALAVLENAPASKPLPKNASKGDIAKYNLCNRFVVFRREKKLSQKTLAEKLEVDPAQMSKILHYNINEFSFDFLFDLLLKIYPKADIKIDLAS